MLCFFCCFNRYLEQVKKNCIFLVSMPQTTLSKFSRFFFINTNKHEVTEKKEWIGRRREWRALVFGEMKKKECELPFNHWKCFWTWIFWANMSKTTFFSPNTSPLYMTIVSFFLSFYSTSAAMLQHINRISII